MLCDNPLEALQYIRPKEDDIIKKNAGNLSQNSSPDKANQDSNKKIDVDEVFGFDEWDKEGDDQVKDTEIQPKEEETGVGQEEDKISNVEDLFQFDAEGLGEFVDPEIQLSQKTAEEAAPKQEEITKAEDTQLDNEGSQKLVKEDLEVKQDRTGDGGFRINVKKVQVDEAGSETEVVEEFTLVKARAEDDQSNKSNSSSREALFKAGPDRGEEIYMEDVDQEESRSSSQKRVIQRKNSSPSIKEIEEKEGAFTVKILSFDQEVTPDGKPAASGNNSNSRLQKSQVTPESKNSSSSRQRTSSQRIEKYTSPHDSIPEVQNGEDEQENEEVVLSRRKRVSMENSSQSQSQSQNIEENPEHSWFQRLTQERPEEPKRRYEPAEMEISMFKEPPPKPAAATNLSPTKFNPRKRQDRPEVPQDTLDTFLGLPEDINEMDFDEQELINEMRDLEDTENLDKVGLVLA